MVEHGELSHALFTLIRILITLLSPKVGMIGVTPRDNCKNLYQITSQFSWLIKLSLYHLALDLVDRTVYYGQFRCYGPGANATGRASWSKELTMHDALPFIELSFIDGT